MYNISHACNNCETSFTPKWKPKHSTVYCSKNCANTKKPRRRKEGACKQCSVAINSSRVYCGVDCLKKSQDQKIYDKIYDDEGNEKLKRCSSCKEEKEPADFYSKGKRQQSMCKSCFIRYSMDRWIQKKKDAIADKGGICLDCKGIFHYAVYDFHHRDPESKDYNWTDLRSKSAETIKKELDKCDLLCANCHRMRHVCARTGSDF